MENSVSHFKTRLLLLLLLFCFFKFLFCCCCCRFNVLRVNAERLKQGLLSREREHENPSGRGASCLIENRVRTLSSLSQPYSTDFFTGCIASHLLHVFHHDSTFRYILRINDLEPAGFRQVNLLRFSKLGSLWKK